MSPNVYLYIIQSFILKVLRMDMENVDNIILNYAVYWNCEFFPIFAPSSEALTLDFTARSLPYNKLYGKKVRRKNGSDINHIFS